MPLYAIGDLRPQLPEDGRVFVAPSADVIGDVRLLSGASVWFGCVLRGDNEPITVGIDSNVQDGSVLHTDPGSPLVIGRGVTVGHATVLHGCVIGDFSLVGMGATILNGAKIGRNCIIGGNALVKENAVVPDNTVLVGAPAKRIKDVDADGEAMLQHLYTVYVEKRERYRESLHEL